MKLRENEHIEFKRSTSELKEGIISIVSILNKHGKGELYFGVKNDGTIVGLDITDKTLREISHAISSNIQPKIYPTIIKETYKGKDYIKVSFSGNDKPYFAFGRVYLRVADEDRQLSPKEIERLILEKNIYRSKWDSKLSKHKISEVNESAISLFMNQLSKSGRIPNETDDFMDVLRKLGLIDSDKLTYAAWYLFCDNQPIEWQVAVFKGKDKTSFMDIKPPLKRNILYLLKKVIEYIKDKINWKVEFGEDMKRYEIPEIPIAALREAIVNSLVHRDYNSPNPNEIAIFSDRIEIYNPGSFPEGLSPDDFIKGKERSHLRNPKIAETFYYMGYIDRWASGLQRIDKECRENGVKYFFAVLDEGFLVTFYRPNFYTNVYPNKKEKVRVKIRGKTRVKILKSIESDPFITISELAQIVGITKKGVEWHIARLKKEGIIRRVGSARNGYWEIIDKSYLE